MTTLTDDIILQHHHVTEIAEDLGALARVNPDAIELHLPFAQVAAFANTDTCQAMQRISQDHGAAFYHAVFLALLDKEGSVDEVEAQCRREEADFDRGIKRGLKMALEMLQDVDDPETWSSLVQKRVNADFGVAVNSD